MPRRPFAVVFCIAAVLTGCNGNTTSSAPLPSITSIGGSEAVLLRITREGGFPRSYRWPTIDVAAWTGTERLPAVKHVLGFDDVGGQIAIEGADGKIGRLDLHSGHAEFSEKPVGSASSPDGTWIYGISEAGRVWRASDNDDWNGPVAHADSMFALPGGNVVLVSNTEKQTRLVRLRPPSLTPDDTIEVPLTARFVSTPSGDRLYALTHKGVVTVDMRAWKLVTGPRSGGQSVAIAPTPSGDRAFVLAEDGKSIRVWERYSERFSSRIMLPKTATDLRMDPMGRFLLARMDSVDSAFVLSVPVTRIVRTVSTAWREDLPMFTPDGSMLALIKDEVHLIDPVSGSRRRRIRGGARDLWAFVRWDGFKPRDSSLDTPAIFELDPPIDSVNEADKIDSILAARAEIVAREQLDSIARATAGSRRNQDTSALSYTLSFASLLSESAARTLAGRVRVDGRPPRIIPSTRDGITIYRVVMGPFPTREAADEAGKRSGMPYWVIVGLP